MESTTSQLNDETSVVVKEPGRYETHLNGRWNIGENPNGGYAQTSSIRAIADVLGRPDPLSVTTHFLRPAMADEPGLIEVDEVRSGRRTATATASMMQGGKERTRTLAAFGDLGARPTSDVETVHDLVPPPVDLTPVDECPSRIELEQGVELPILSRVDVRVDPRWQRGGADRAEVTGWIRLGDEADVDTTALTLFADAFPPSVFSLFGRIGWVPTLELTVHIRRRPVPGWIRGRFRTRDLTGSFLIEDGELWDESGALVAQSRQLAVFNPE